MDIVVVGGLPEPIGGVTTFLKRYSRAHESDIFQFIDCYPSVNKHIPLGLSDKFVSLKSKYLLPMYLFLNSYNFRGKVIFFNFSQLSALILLLAVFKPRKTTWHLMLHHGDLSVDNVILKAVISFALKKFDVIYSLSPTQHGFYNSVGFGDKTVNTSSYVPTLVECENDCYYEIKNNILELRKKFGKIFISSGYATRIYNHDAVIELSQGVLSGSCIIIFLYGPKEGRMDIIEKASFSDNVIIMEDCDEDVFNSYLSLSDCYLRPTLKDSFGIAVADAINLGIDCIASDVCERYQGSIIFDVNKDDELTNIVGLYLTSGELNKSKYNVEEFFIYDKFD